MRRLKDLIHGLFWSAGYSIARIPNRTSDLERIRSMPDMQGGLLRAKGLNLPIASILDVGASDGRWTLDCLGVFPDARYLLVEALKIHEPGLAELRQARPNVEYVIAAAGDSEGQTYFNVTDDPLGGWASHTAFSDADLLVPMTTLDSLVARFKLPPPYCIKLDTHGFELPILDGAVETLKQTELLIVEAYNFEMKRANRTLRFHELCAYMEAGGFRCADLVDPLRRHRDSLLWQMDLIFVPATRPEFQYSGFY